MSDFGEYPAARTVRFDRLLPGPIERVWEHLTRPEMLAGWLAGGVFEPREGGAVDLRFTNDDALTGVVTVWEPPRRLAYTWREQGSESVVSFELTPQDDGVRLILTHVRLPQGDAASFGAGWHSHLDVLARLLNDGPPIDFEAHMVVYRRLRPDYDARALN